MDWGRFMRAMHARRVARVEAQRKRGVADPKALTAEQWAEVEANDLLLSDFYGD